MVPKPAFLSRLRKHAWSIRDMLWMTVYAAIVLVMCGEGGTHWPSMVWIGLMSGLAFCSVRQVVLLILGRELPFDPVTGRTLRWSLAATRLASVIFLMVGCRWPEPGGWWSSFEPGELLYEYPLVNGYDYGYFWSFALRSLATSLILPMGILFACFPLWGFRRADPGTVASAARNYRRLAGKLLGIGLGLVLGLIVLSQLQSINALVFMAIRGINSGMKHPNGAHSASTDWMQWTGQYFDQALLATVAAIAALLAVLLLGRRSAWLRLVGVVVIAGGSLVAFWHCLRIRTVTLPTMLEIEGVLTGWPDRSATACLAVVVAAVSWILVWIFVRNSRATAIELDPVRLARFSPPPVLCWAMGIWLLANTYIVAARYTGGLPGSWQQVFHEDVWVHGQMQGSIGLSIESFFNFWLSAFLIIWAASEIARRGKPFEQRRITAWSNSPGVVLLLATWTGIAISIFLAADAIGQLSRAAVLAPDLHPVSQMLEGLEWVRGSGWPMVVSAIAVGVVVVIGACWFYAAARRWLLADADAGPQSGSGTGGESGLPDESP